MLIRRHSLWQVVFCHARNRGCTYFFLANLATKNIFHADPHSMLYFIGPWQPPHVTTLLATLEELLVEAQELASCPLEISSNLDP